VKQFVERLDTLPPDARALLARRGLTPETVGVARALLARISSMDEDDPRPGMTRIDRDAARDVWNWYLEWSHIARVTIRDRRLLRAMGFHREKASDDADE
jgi:hypothetical protein